MTIALIAAMTPTRVIGRLGQLPWRLSADLRRFKRLTMGHTLIMGRRTWESIGRPLPGRTSIVLSRQADFHPDGATVAADLDSALALVATPCVFIVGGGEIYRLALDRAEKLYVTLVEADIAGDVDFPVIDLLQWEQVEDTPHVADAKNEYDYRFQLYLRKPLL